jgi:hypothetical protein
LGRHEILRTAFCSINGQPSQIVNPETEIDLSVADLTDAPAERRNEKSRKIAAEFSAQPFDLTACPLLRLKIIKIDESEQLLVIVFHHIISDGWSVGVFLQELSASYASEISGSPASLVELPIQYADYALWQQRWLATDDYGDSSNSEKRIERRARAARTRDRLRASGGSTLSRRAIVRIAVRRMTERLKVLSRSENATLFMTLLSAWQVLLARYSGQNQIVVGTPVAGRTATETENLIGFFVNTLALRGDLSGDITFNDLLRRKQRKGFGRVCQPRFTVRKAGRRTQSRKKFELRAGFSNDVRAAKRAVSGRKFRGFKDESDQNSEKKRRNSI